MFNQDIVNMYFVMNVPVVIAYWMLYKAFIRADQEAVLIVDFLFVMGGSILCMLFGPLLVIWHTYESTKGVTYEDDSIRK